MKKNYNILRNIVALIAISVALVAETFALEPPKMQCLKLLNNNQRMKIAWSNSPDCADFAIYYFYINNQLYDSLTISSGTSGYTFCDYGTVEINNIPAAEHYNCWIVAVDSFGNRFNSDTIHSISLTVTPIADLLTNAPTMALLNWESPTQVLDQGWGNVFNIYKKRAFDTDFPTSPFATVPNTQLQYTDTSDVCNDTLFYQVSITNYYGSNEHCPFMTTIGSAFLTDGASPEPPTLDSVTVTPTNEVMLGFHENEAHMMAYIIYYETPDGYLPLDTVYNQTFWVDPNFDPSEGTRYYRIAAMDSCENSSPLIPTSEQQCNVKLQVLNKDGCNKNAVVSWNAYEHLSGGVDHYEIYISQDPAQSWTYVGETSNLSYMIDNLELNQNYFVYVQVKNTAGNITAKSNRVSFVIEANASTDFSYISTVSVINNSYLQIKVLTSGDTLGFVSITLQKSEDGITFEDFKTLPYSNSTALYFFYDSAAKFDRNTYYYRTYLIDNCGTKVAQSNVSHNILLLGEALTQSNILSWKGYDNWDGGVKSYYVMRKTEAEEGFNTISIVQPGTLNSYQDDVSQDFESGSKFVYYVEGSENTNNYGLQEYSVSNQLTLVQTPTLFIPNAFRPSGSNNSVFRPVNSFVSIENYRLSIFTRTGELIFVTTNPQEGWDGRNKEGKLLPVGVYVYYLEYKMPDGTIMERNGTITLVR